MERRVYTVTGTKASADEVDRMIETGESENIFQKAILEQGRGHVSVSPPSKPLLASYSPLGNKLGFQCPGQAFAA